MAFFGLFKKSPNVKRASQVSKKTRDAETRAYAKAYGVTDKVARRRTAEHRARGEVFKQVKEPTPQHQAAEKAQRERTERARHAAVRRIETRTELIKRIDENKRNIYGSSARWDAQAADEHTGHYANGKSRSTESLRRLAAYLDDVWDNVAGEIDPADYLEAMDYDGLFYH